MNKSFKILGLIGFFGLTGLFGFVSCKSNTPSSGGGWPKQFNLCYEEIYGHCYDSVPCAVVALDLYSDGLTLNEDHRIQGTGFNLYLSDIFVPGSLLEEGEYKSLSLLDFQPSPFTFLPGRDFEGTPNGMYLLQIEENRIARIQVLDSGAFAYRNDSLLFTLYYRNTYGTRSTYKCTFHGTLTPWQKP